MDVAIGLLLLAAGVAAVFALAGRFGFGPMAPPLAPEGSGPKVSLHIPAYREPPEMLKATLDAVARLTYQNFECIIVINNTPDPAL